MAGLNSSKGDYVVTMDDDGQNPPSEAVKLVNAIESKADVVFSRYSSKSIPTEKSDEHLMTWWY